MPVLSTVGAASFRSFGFGLKGAITPEPLPPGPTPPPPPYSDFIVATGGSVYVDPYNANYKIHQFTGGDVFNVISCPPDATVEAMAIAGGGSGEYGGGGAGGYVYKPSVPVSIGTFSIAVGSGAINYAVSGGNTTFLGYNVGVWALAGGNATAIFPEVSTSGGSGAGGTDTYNSPLVLNGGAATQPTSASGGYGNKGAPWFGEGTNGLGSGSNGGGGGAGSAGFEEQGGSGRSVDIVSSSGAFETVCRGGWGSRNGVAYALPAVVAGQDWGNGGWGGKLNDENGNYLEYGPGRPGLLRVRYKFQ